MRLLEHVYLLASGAGGFDWTEPGDCNVYLLDGGGELAVVDTGTGESVPRIIEHIEQAELPSGRVGHILLTHLHADHAGGAARLREITDARVVANQAGQRILETADEAAIDLPAARANGFYPPDYRLAACPVDRPVRDGDTFRVGSLEVRVRVLPGHSHLDTYYFVRTPAGHVSLFTGDGFFFGGRISMLNTHDFDLKGLARAAEALGDERVDSLFAGHLQPALANGGRHILLARDAFRSLRVPPNIL